MSKIDGVSTEKNASDRADISMSCKARFSFQSLHKLLDTAYIYLGLTFKHCYMLELFYIYRFYFRQVVMIWEETKYNHFAITYRTELF